ncbi:MAG: cysteine-rich repeat protein [Deltaproteobacteria bacterium]|nr:cysteine-rich repeat protein [Deltaproteobacteria bacterium]
MQRIGLCAILIAGCGSPSPGPSAGPALVLGQPPSEWFEPTSSAQPLFASHGGTWELDLDPVLATPRALRGSGVPFVTSGTSEGALERAALAFVREQPGLFGTDELVFDGAVLDRELWSIALAQRHHGLPVVSAHLGLTISHGRLILVQGVTYPIRDVDTTPRVALATAIASVRDALEQPGTGDRDSARLVILPERSPGAVAYHVAWEVTAWRGPLQAVAYVDAHDGRLLGGYDANRYDYPGVATNHVDERTVGDTVVPLPAAHLRLHSARGTATTDATGAFVFRGEAGPLFVTANLHGAYVDVQNQQGPNASFVGVMRADSPYALEWTESRSTPEERDVFRAVNTTNRFVATVFPDLAWLAQPLVAKVDHPRTCNAYWNGSSINFFVAGNGCNNTGRIFDVVAHEWGHALDAHAPGAAIDGGLGEFIGDLISFVQTNSPLLGPGFFTDGGPVRDLDDPAFQCFDPKKREVHDAGQLLGAVMWDVFGDLQRIGMTGEARKRLLLRPIAIAQTRSEWYGAMLAVDDDDGNLANGTPHECLIYNQFKAHSCGGARWPGIPANDPPHCTNTGR